MKIVKGILRIITSGLCLSAFSSNAQSVEIMKYGNLEFKERMIWLRSNEVEKFDEFYSFFIESIEVRNFDKIAELIKYPITIDVNRKKVTIKNSIAFKKIATKALKASFLCRALSQKNELFCLSKGVMLGRGEFWFDTENRDQGARGIIAINN